MYLGRPFPLTSSGYVLNTRWRTSRTVSLPPSHQCQCRYNPFAVALDFYRLRPTGRAWLTLSSPNYMQHALKAMRGAVLSGKTLGAAPAKDPSELNTRTRGVRGRLQAAERGLLTGNGPYGMSTSRGKGVVLYGMPGKLTPDSLRTYLKNFKLAVAEAGQREIVKLETPYVSELYLLPAIRSPEDCSLDRFAVISGSL